MKKREEIEMRFYETIGVRKLSKVFKKMTNFSDNLSNIFTPKAKKKEKMAERRAQRFNSSKKMEDVIGIKKDYPGWIRSDILFIVITGTFALISFPAFRPLFLIENVCFACQAVSKRYALLRSKQMIEKWQTKYENQKEDTLNEILTASKEMGHPAVEIISKNNKVNTSSLRRITQNAELKELKKYRDYLADYKVAQENNEPLPTIEYGENKTLRLVPNYARRR